MSLDPLERARRLVPLAVLAAALVIAVAPAALRAGVVPGPRGWLAPALIGLAAAVCAHAVAAARPGWSGVVGGAVAGLWLAACPLVRTIGAAGLAPGGAAVALLAVAGGLVAGERLARAGAGPADRGLVLATLAIAAVLADLRAWPLALVAGALLAWRAERQAKWLALGPGLAGLTGGVLVLVAALGRGPRWAAPPPARALEAWLADAVDLVGPLALVAGVLGLSALARDRHDRWVGALVVAALATLLPPSAPLAAPALAGWALVVGVAIADGAAQLGRPAHQALAGAALAVVLAGPFALT